MMYKEVIIHRWIHNFRDNEFLDKIAGVAFRYENINEIIPPAKESAKWKMI